MIENRTRRLSTPTHMEVAVVGWRAPQHALAGMTRAAERDTLASSHLLHLMRLLNRHCMLQYCAFFERVPCRCRTWSWDRAGRFNDITSRIFSFRPSTFATRARFARVNKAPNNTFAQESLNGPIERTLLESVTDSWNQTKLCFPLCSRGLPGHGLRMRSKTSSQVGYYDQSMFT